MPERAAIGDIRALFPDLGAILQAIEIRQNYGNHGR
jgi:hypothetical protein